MYGCNSEEGGCVCLTCQKNSLESMLLPLVYDFIDYYAYDYNSFRFVWTEDFKSFLSDLEAALWNLYVFGKEGSTYSQRDLSCRQELIGQLFYAHATNASESVSEELFRQSTDRFWNIAHEINGRSCWYADWLERYTASINLFIQLLLLTRESMKKPAE